MRSSSCVSALFRPLLIALLGVTLGCAEPPVISPPEDELPTDAVGVVGVALSKEDAGLLAGESLTLELTATLEDGSEQIVTKGVAWSSSASDVATVTPHGVVTGVAPGLAVIEGRVGTLTAAARITIVDPDAVTSIEVTPANLATVAGVPFTVDAEITATLSDGTRQDVSDMVTWQSADAELLVQLPTGEFLGLVTGWARLSGSVWGQPVGLDVHISGTSLRSIRFTQQLYRLLPSAGHEASFRVEGVFGARVSDLTALATYEVEHPAVGVPTPGTLKVATTPSEPASEFQVKAGLNGMSATADVRLAPRRLFVGDNGGFVLSFGLTPELEGNAAPLQKISYNPTSWGAPHSVVFDPVNDELVVANFFKPYVTTFAGSLEVNGNQVPLRSFQTPGQSHMGIAYDVARDILYAADWGSSVIFVYERPRRHESGSPLVTRRMSIPAPSYHLALDPQEDRLFTTSGWTTHAVESASTPDATVRVAGRGSENTALALDPQRQRLYTATHGGKVRVYSDVDTDGDTEPTAIVTVPGAVDLGYRGIVHDPETDALYVSGYERDRPTILVFSNASTFVGEIEVAPSARISGAATQLKDPRGLAIGW